MRFLTCQECGAPAEVQRVYDLPGAGFGPPGTECIVSMAKVLCAAGHRLDMEYDRTEMTP